MYNMIPFITGGAAIVIGIVMYFAPKSCTKKDNRNDPQEVAKTKKTAWLVMGCGIVMFVIGLI